MTFILSQEKLKYPLMSSSKNPGWIIHFVPDEKFPVKGMTGLYNIHTHGILEKYNHLDIQIVCPVPPQIAHIVIWDMVKND
jgi:hypothetical protein